MQISPRITPMVGFTLLINVLMGTGPIFLPGPFLLVGWLFGTIFMVLIAIISYICFDLIIEAMSNYNALISTDSMSFRNSDTGGSITMDEH